MTRILLHAAEPSGDAIGALVAAELRRRLPDAVIRGLAGPAMIAAGVAPLAPVENLGVLGIVEALGHVGAAWRAREAARRALPGADLVVTVDAPDLMLCVAADARSKGTPTVHIVAPQVWAWRPGRVRRVARAVDTLVAFFPWEAQWFASTSLHVATVGHPLAAVGTHAAEASTYALMPGSRASEHRRYGPVLCAVAAAIRAREPMATFLVPAPSGTLGDLDATYVPTVREAARRSRSVAVASGTATLEVAAVGAPMAILGLLHPVTTWLARRWLTVKHVGLPNLIVDRRAVPEFLAPIDPGAVADVMLAAEPLPSDVGSAIVALGAEGAVHRIGAVLLERLSTGPR